MVAARLRGALAVLGVLAFCLVAAAEPVVPRERTPLFNGRDLGGLTTWLKETEREDPHRVFSAIDGVLRLSGEGNGYIATQREFHDYHLLVEYKWGRKTDGGKYVRNSGILLHATGPAGGAGAWPACLECQLAQGCVGDFIVIRGKDERGEVIPVAVTAETELAPDEKRRRWKAGGETRSFPPTRGQLWWSRHDWDFAELLDTRGKDDVESPLGEWTRVECLCRGDQITVRVNGHTVNYVTRVHPAAGRIGLQTEGFEVFFRKFELLPLEPKSN